MNGYLVFLAILTGIIAVLVGIVALDELLRRKDR